MFDSFLKIGSSHNICEDYCLIKQDVAILCDGCSSAKHTDVGTRLLAHCYFGTPNPRNILGGVFGQSFGMAKQLELPRECLLATINSIYVSNNKAYVHMYGDGVLYVKKKLEKEIIHIDFNNAPFYYYYDHFGLRDLYLNTFGAPNKVINGEKCGCVDFREPSYASMYDLTDIEYILLFSDGVCSFQKPYSEIIGELTDFKSFNGEFLKRRIKYLFRKEWRDYTHHDDFSVVGITP